MSLRIVLRLILAPSPLIFHDKSFINHKSLMINLEWDYYSLALSSIQADFCLLRIEITLLWSSDIKLSTVIPSSLASLIVSSAVMEMGVVDEFVGDDGGLKV